jgi:hypothetical protein
MVFIPENLPCYGITFSCNHLQGIVNASQIDYFHRNAIAIGFANTFSCRFGGMERSAEGAGDLRD